MVGFCISAILMEFLCGLRNELQCLSAQMGTQIRGFFLNKDVIELMFIYCPTRQSYALYLSPTILKVWCNRNCVSFPMGFAGNFIKYVYLIQNVK